MLESQSCQENWNAPFDKKFTKTHFTLAYFLSSFPSFFKRSPTPGCLCFGFEIGHDVPFHLQLLEFTHFPKKNHQKTAYFEHLTECSNKSFQIKRIHKFNIFFSFYWRLILYRIVTYRGIHLNLPFYCSPFYLYQVYRHSCFLIKWKWIFKLSATNIFVLTF